VPPHRDARGGDLGRLGGRLLVAVLPDVGHAQAARCSTSVAGYVLVTATRVTSPGSRPASGAGVGDQSPYLVKV
jgi:hypothetical protein